MLERRTITAVAPRVETRGEGDTARPAIVGHAARYDEWTTLYEGRYFTWREVIRPGAFKRAIKEKHDVRALFNHDANYVLGRTTSGTLKLSEDDAGLMTETDPPATQTIRDLVVAPIERGDVTGMSFAFSVPKGSERKVIEKPDGTRIVETKHERVTVRRDGDREIEEREILDVDLHDISPVTYPAYEGTDVAMRSTPDLRAVIEARDVPHKRPAPKREAIRQWLDQSGTTPGGA